MQFKARLEVGAPLRQLLVYGFNQLRKSRRSGRAIFGEYADRGVFCRRIVQDGRALRAQLDQRSRGSHYANGRSRFWNQAGTAVSMFFEDSEPAMRASEGARVLHESRKLEKHRG